MILLDKEHPESLAPEGEPGELAVCGPQVMRGYWNHPESDADTFVERDGKRYLRTGDVARVDADGFLEIVDRIKDMIAVGGFKVFPSVVEDVILEHPAVKEALVIGVPEEYRGEVPRAYVTLKDGAAADGGGIGGLAQCQDRQARTGRCSGDPRRPPTHDHRQAGSQGAAG